MKITGGKSLTLLLGTYSIFCGAFSEASGGFHCRTFQGVAPFLEITVLHTPIEVPTTVARRIEFDEIDESGNSTPVFAFTRNQIQSSHITREAGHYTIDARSLQGTRFSGIEQLDFEISPGTTRNLPIGRTQSTAVLSGRRTNGRTVPRVRFECVELLYGEYTRIAVQDPNGPLLPGSEPRDPGNSYWEGIPDVEEQNLDGFPVTYLSGTDPRSSGGKGEIRTLEPR